MPNACTLCESTDIRRVFEKERLPFYRCRACGFLFALPLVNPNLHNHIDDYEPAYLDYLRETRNDARNLERVFDWVARYGDGKGARLLDVGSGSGKLVRYFRRRSVEAFGLEPSAALYREFLAGEPHFYEQTIDSFAASSAGRGQQFDFVTAIDVIEHIQNPHSFFLGVAKLLKPDGHLFVTVPDAGSALARIAGKAWHHFNKYHLSYFSKQTLTETAARYHLQIEECTRRGRLHSVGYMVKYLAAFVFKRPNTSLPARFDDIFVPINMFDTIHACFRNDSGEPGAVLKDTA